MLWSLWWWAYPYILSRSTPLLCLPAEDWTVTWWRGLVTWWGLRSSQRNLWGALGWCFLCSSWAREENRVQQPSSVPGLCPATRAGPVWCSVIAQVLHFSVRIVYLAPTVLDYSYVPERCKYLDLLQNRSVLLLFRRFLFLISSVIFLLLHSFLQKLRIFGSKKSM